MLPIKLTADTAESERARWKIVRRDSFEDVPGLIVSADTDSGDCTLQDPQGSGVVTHHFGPGGFSIAPAR